MKKITTLGIGVGLIAAVWLAGGCGSRPSGTPAPAGSPSAVQAELWTCSMHPQIRQSEPGQCPICGMNLVPMAKEDVKSK